MIKRRQMRSIEFLLLAAACWLHLRFRVLPSEFKDSMIDHAWAYADSTAAIFTVVFMIAAALEAFN